MYKQNRNCTSGHVRASCDDKEEEAEEAEEQEVEIIEEVVEKKKDKGQHSKSKMLTMFIFSSNQLRTDSLYVLQGGSVVSATLGPFARLEGKKKPR